MKWLPVSLLIMVFQIFVSVPFYAFAADSIPTENSLKNIDAVEAIKIANAWRWTHKEVRSYVTTREVVFEFPNGQKYKISLPREKMFVAVAPFIKKTHT